MTIFTSLNEVTINSKFISFLCTLFKQIKNPQNPLKIKTYRENHRLRATAKHDNNCEISFKTADFNVSFSKQVLNLFYCFL